MTAPRVVMHLPPQAGSSPRSTETGLDALREQIRSIERRPTLFSPGRGPETRSEAASSTSSGRGIWTLGDRSPDDCGSDAGGHSGDHSETGLDQSIGTGGLEIGAVHEIKPTAGVSWAAAFASAYHFALALAVRRLIAAPPSDRSAPVLLCFSAAQSTEMGAPYAPGLSGLGLDPERLILVEAARQADVLWAIEEGLKSEGLALVLGQIDAVGLTSARRLALAAARTSTPCLLLTHPRYPAAAATATRWRVSPAPSASHPLDPEAPGAPRFLVGLERCRGSPAAVLPGSYLLEWSNAAYRFRMAAGMVDGASRPRAPESWPSRAMGGGERP